MAETVEELLAGSPSSGEDEEPTPDPQPDKRKPSRPRPTRKKVDNKTRPGGQTARKDLTQELTAMFSSMAMPLFMFGRQHPKLAYDSYVLLANAEELAKALNSLAQRNAVVHRVLFAMMNTTDSVVLLTALSNVAIPIAANHGLLPPQTAVAFNAPDPTTFDAMSAMNGSKPE